MSRALDTEQDQWRFAKRMLRKRVKEEEDVHYDDVMEVIEDCQSPIERMLLLALWAARPPWWADSLERAELWSMGGQEIEGQGADPLTDDRTVVVPQYPVGKYTADFAVFFGKPWARLKTIIECDGHDFHERTKEQAKHDKRRDRWFSSNGWLVLRYTGSEIYKNPYQTASDAFLAIGDAYVSRGLHMVARDG